MPDVKPCACLTGELVESDDAQIGIEGMWLVLYDAVTSWEETRFDIKYCPFCGRPLIN